jgi:pSer/pThr/pTyr-binding forkhead associated (FHA) protein
VDITLSPRFAAACGATHPLDLVVEREDGVVLAQGMLDQPFALLGRDPCCDIHLSDPAVEPRHAFLQVIGGRVFVADLGSRTGVHWPHGPYPYGWLTAGDPVQFGPFRVYLARPVSDRPAVFGPTFHPLAAGPDVPADLPPATVEFRSARTARSTWEVNRVLTLVGRAKECKISLVGDDVLPHHAYLLRTADGLWAVDLSGRGGVRVNGRPARFARLGPGDELRIGRFALACVPSPKVDSGRVRFDLAPARPAAVPMHLSATPAGLRHPPARSLPGDDASTGRMRPAEPLTQLGPVNFLPQPTMLAPDGALPSAEAADRYQRALARLTELTNDKKG